MIRHFFVIQSLNCSQFQCCYCKNKNKKMNKNTSAIFVEFDFIIELPTPPPPLALSFDFAFQFLFTLNFKNLLKLPFIYFFNGKTVLSFPPPPKQSTKMQIIQISAGNYPFLACPTHMLLQYISTTILWFLKVFNAIICCVQPFSSRNINIGIHIIIISLKS